MKRFEHALLGATFASLAATSTAYAHIDMLGDVLGRQGDESQIKLSPCDGPAAGKPVYAFEPGATIKLQVNERIRHPGYFRIAFDDNGQDGFKEPAVIDPVDPSRGCPVDGADGQDQCVRGGGGDFCNVLSSTGGASVLWDNLDPHNATIFDPPKVWTYTVTLPNVECESCVLQVLQIMEDNLAHGPYCPQGSPKCNAAGSLEDIYHRCIDIKLKKGAGMTPGTVSIAPMDVKNNGLLCPYAAGSTGDAGVPMTGSDAGVVVVGGGNGMASDGGMVDHGSHGADGGISGTTTGGSTSGGTTTGTPGVDGGTTGSTSKDDSGCAAAPGRSGREGAGAFALALAGLLVARRRRRSVV